MATQTNTRSQSAFQAPESASPAKLYGRQFPKATRDMIFAKAMEYGAPADQREELVGSEWRVLSTLERLGQKMVGGAEDAKRRGKKHDAAYTEFHTFVAAVWEGSRAPGEPRPAKVEAPVVVVPGTFGEAVGSEELTRLRAQLAAAEARAAAPASTPASASAPEVAAH